MITLGIDAHKRTHTVVAVDDLGRQRGHKTTTATSSDDHLALVRWADRFGPDRQWAVEDCRHLSRRLEADMLAAGERIVRVATPKPKRSGHSSDVSPTWFTALFAPTPNHPHQPERTRSPRPLDLGANHE